jgi:hypothetical protein
MNILLITSDQQHWAAWGAMNPKVWPRVCGA